MKEPGIYLDNNATTAVDERVVEAMLVALREKYGNPSSAHRFGEAAARLVETARASVARLVGARTPGEIVFTSGGTESINTAFQVALDAQGSRRRVLTSATEHSAVLRGLEPWCRRGIEVNELRVRGDGRVPVEETLERIATLGSELALVSLHWANNETGVRFEAEELTAIARACSDHGARLHVDAVQIPGKHPLALDAIGADFASFSAHKFHGPKGIGALYVRSGRAPEPFPSLIAGGPQEHARRAGTQNVPGIVGMGRAAELALEHVSDEGACAEVRALRERLETGLLAAIPGSRVNGAGAPRVDNTSNLVLPGVDGELLLMSLAAEGLALSTGSACTSDSRAPSHVLRAMGLADADAMSSVRISLSRFTTPEEVETALDLVPRVAAELRALETV